MLWCLILIEGCIVAPCSIPLSDTTPFSLQLFPYKCDANLLTCDYTSMFKEVKKRLKVNQYSL